ncbi:MAG: hypothetical protein WBC78_16770 [Candidatus Sulfotelmatobacter sp.]
MLCHIACKFLCCSDLFWGTEQLNVINRRLQVYELTWGRVAVGRCYEPPISLDEVLNA